MKLEFPRYAKNIEISNFMKICSVGTELFSGNWVVQWELSCWVGTELFSGNWVVQWELSCWVGTALLSGNWVVQWEMSCSVGTELLSGNWVVEWELSCSVGTELFSGNWVVQWELSCWVGTELFSGNWVVPCGHIDGQKDMTKRIIYFRNFVNKHENLSSYHTENAVLLQYKEQLIFRTKKILSLRYAKCTGGGGWVFRKLKKSGVKFRNYSFLSS